MSKVLLITSEGMSKLIELDRRSNNSFKGYIFNYVIGKVLENDEVYPISYQDFLSRPEILDNYDSGCVVYESEDNMNKYRDKLSIYPLAYFFDYQTNK